MNACCAALMQLPRTAPFGRYRELIVRHRLVSWPNGVYFSSYTGAPPKFVLSPHAPGARKTQSAHTSAAHAHCSTGAHPPQRSHQTMADIRVALLALIAPAGSPPRCPGRDVQGRISP